jgi:hypothetical protein
VGRDEVSASFSDLSGAYAASGSDPSFGVVRGPLSSMALGPSTATITAGANQTYSVTGFDAYDKA